MSRFLSALVWEWRLQWRHGLFYAAAFVVLVWGIVLRQLPADLVGYVLAPVLYIDLSIFGFYFMAGLLYLEKGEGVLQALVVTPLRGREYLAAKLASLTTLGVLVSLCVTALVRAPTVNWLWLAAAVAINSLFFILMGFVLAVRYDAISEFFVPSMWFLALAQLPFLDFYAVWQGWPLYLAPFQAAMLLVRGAFEPLALWQWVYALTYVLGGIAVALWWAGRAFERFVVRSEGAA